jgi:hypothetical protein
MPIYSLLETQDKNSGFFLLQSIVIGQYVANCFFHCHSISSTTSKFSHIHEKLGAMSEKCLFERRFLISSMRCVFSLVAIAHRP